jgi:hypothetical protein
MSLGRRGPRQRDNEFGKSTRPGLDVDLAAMLFHHNVMAHRQAKSSAFARGLVVKNGLNIFSFTPNGIPVPLSRIRISTRSPRFFVRLAR